MPELPEVETISRGISPHIVGSCIKHAIVRQFKLRLPVAKDFAARVTNQRVEKLSRRGKYLLFSLPNTSLILHLGMSGTLRILPNTVPALKHDHVDLLFDNQFTLRFNDPRRFGLIILTDQDPTGHSLLRDLGIEPLTTQFTGNYLFSKASKRRVSIKQFIMDNHVVVGVGNIYAAESLFLAGIDPRTPANAIDKTQYENLVKSIKTILRQAIKQGGTTIRDFVTSTGKPGYFSQALCVYGRHGKKCVKCHKTLQIVLLGQRTTVYCPHCQQ